MCCRKVSRIGVICDVSYFVSILGENIFLVSLGWVVSEALFDHCGVSFHFFILSSHSL